MKARIQRDTVVGSDDLERILRHERPTLPAPIRTVMGPSFPLAAELLEWHCNPNSKAHQKAMMIRDLTRRARRIPSIF